jgi:hypothetical protein
MKYNVQLSYNPAHRGLPSRSAIELYATSPSDAAHGATQLAGKRGAFTWLFCCVEHTAPAEQRMSDHVAQGFLA